MKLYFSPGACSLASHIALIEGGIAHEAIKVDLEKHETEHGEDFYAISPRGYVPAIETDEFGMLTENSAVLPYLQSKVVAVPEGEEYYRMLEWIGFVGTEIHGAYHPLFGGESDERQAKAKKTLAETYRLTVKLMDGAGWLVGDAPTVADNYLFVTLLWADKMGVDLPQELVEYREKNKKREAVAQALKTEGLG